MAAKLYDAQGREWKGDPLGDLVKLGTPDVKDDGDRVSVSKDAIQRWKSEQTRRLAVTNVPHTPRFMPRDAGGLGVAKGIGRWPHLTFDLLRDLRERAPILQTIHSARAYQVRRMSTQWSGKKGEVGWHVVHKDHNAHQASAPEGFQPFIDRFTDMLEAPAPDYDQPTTGSLMSKLYEDLLTINRPVCEPIHSIVDPRRVVGFQAVDGALIWETLLWMEKWKQDHPTWHGGWDQGQITPTDELDLLSMALDCDLHAAQYVAVQDGVVINTFRRGQLLVSPIQNRTDVRWVGYPPSHVEMAIHMISAFIATFDYNASYFTKGMLAEFILGVPGDMHADDVDAFVDMLREATQGVRNAWQPPILPIHSDKQIQKIDLKQSNKEMMYEMWMSLLIALSTAIYRMDPSTINAKAWDGGQGSKMSEPSRQTEIQLAHEEGLQGDLSHIVSTILDPLAKRCHPDLRVRMEYGNYDPKKDADVYEVRGRTDLSRNEIRLQQGEEPWGVYLTPSELKTADPAMAKEHNMNPWNWPTDPGFASIMSAREKAEQDQMMMEKYGQQQQEPPPGDGFGGKDDGFGGSGGKPGGAPKSGDAPFGRPPAGGPPAPPSPPKPPIPGGAPPAAGGDLRKASPSRVTVFVQETP
jgi:hypothetical protein